MKPRARNPIIAKPTEKPRGFQTCYKNAKKNTPNPKYTKRKMIFFALGGMWNWFMDPWPANTLLFIREPSAIEPRPIPH